jgi:hypothetical protein
LEDKKRWILMEGVFIAARPTRNLTLRLNTT